MSQAAELSQREVLKIELRVLEEEHHDLDLAISALAETGRDILAVRRLKKKKLVLKDRITRIKDKLYPDIIA